METTEKTKLPTAILSALYKNVLISQQVEKEVALDTREIPIQSKKLVALVRSAQENIPATELLFLANVMNACKLNKDEYAAIAAQEDTTTNYLDIQAKFESPVVILFGLPPTAVALPIHFPLFQLQAFQGCKYLSAPQLSAIENDKSLKLQLWQCLKQLFP